MQVTEKIVERARFDWRLPLYGFIGALAVFSPAFYWDRGLSLIVSTIIVGLISLLVLALAVSQKRKRPAILTAVAVFLAVWIILLKNDQLVRDRIRWLVLSRRYKAEVLARPISRKGELKHVEWDGWGFPGAGDTTVYVVFDPNDSLAGAAKIHRPGVFDGLPCEIARVHHLESHWYTVLFYTGETWDTCGRGRRNNVMR